MKAIWNGIVIAESDDIFLCERDYFFPLASVRPQHLRLGSMGRVEAADEAVITFSLQAGGKRCADAIWYYDHPKHAHKGILGRVVFRKEVQIVQ